MYMMYISQYIMCVLCCLISKSSLETLTVTLLTCDAGYRRASNDSHICVACEPGRWIRTTEAA